MLVKAYKTKKIVAGNDLFKILEESLPKKLEEKSIVAIASKIVALYEGRVADPATVSKDELAKKEAEYFLPRETNPFDVMVTVKNSTFIASAGIDESNGNGQYVLWPKDVQESANGVREFLQSHFSLKEVGVVITDSRLTPLRWGVTGVALSHSGFLPIRSYVGKPDVFGRSLRVEKVNDADTIAAAAVGVMGEGDEQTPIAVVSDIPFVTFVDRNPTLEETLAKMGDIERDVFSPLMTSVAWQKGEGK